MIRLDETTRMENTWSSDPRRGPESTGGSDPASLKSPHSSFISPGGVGVAGAPLLEAALREANVAYHEHGSASSEYRVALAELEIVIHRAQWAEV